MNFGRESKPGEFSATSFQDTVLEHEILPLPLAAARDDGKINSFSTNNIVVVTNSSTDHHEFFFFCLQEMRSHILVF